MDKLVAALAAAATGLERYGYGYKRPLSGLHSDALAQAALIREHINSLASAPTAAAPEEVMERAREIAASVVGQVCTMSAQQILWGDSDKSIEIRIALAALTDVNRRGRDANLADRTQGADR